MESIKVSPLYNTWRIIDIIDGGIIGISKGASSIMEGYCTPR